MGSLGVGEGGGIGGRPLEAATIGRLPPGKERQFTGREVPPSPVVPYGELVHEVSHFSLQTIGPSSWSP